MPVNLPQERPAGQPAGPATFFARVSLDLMQAQAETSTMQRIAERAVQTVPGCDHSGISLSRRRHPVEQVAATSSVAEKCDALQCELDEGPCLETVWDGEASSPGQPPSALEAVRKSTSSRS